MKWVDARERLPEVGSPVLVVANDATQHITYELSECEAYFEAYFFDEYSEVEIPVDEVTHWAPMPKSPKELEWSREVSE